MDCYVCSPDTSADDNENHCEACRYELCHLQEWMRDKTGDPGWEDSNIPFLDLHIDQQRMVEGFIAGAQMPFRVEMHGCHNQLVRITEPEFQFISINSV